MNCPCICHFHTDRHERYGMYIRATGSKYNYIKWMHVAKKNMPKEFIVTLFLLGIES